MKPQDDRISQIMNDSEQVRVIIQSAINAALLMHKQAGNPICESRDGRVVWIKPEDIHIEKGPSPVCSELLILIKNQCIKADALSHDPCRDLAAKARISLHFWIARV